jgi:hypothetical protein
MSDEKDDENYEDGFTIIPCDKCPVKIIPKGGGFSVRPTKRADCNDGQNCPFQSNRIKNNLY